MDGSSWLPFAVSFPVSCVEYLRTRSLLAFTRSLPNAGPEEAIDIPALCIELDAWISHSDRDVDTGQAAARRMVAGYMDRSIQAFSARWLSILIPEGGDENQDTVVQQLWRRARRDMLQAINKPSYSSMLSLFIFALTPIPTGISESEELDGISGQVCIHAALQHIQMLRARQRNLQFSGSKVFPCSQDTLADSPPMSPPTTEYITAESKAFWAALTFDTSASLTLNCRSLLSAGLFGFEEESSWRLVRAGSKIFYETVKEWTANKHMKITDDMANEIISTSTAWKLLTWKLVAVFKEALRDGHDESEINSTFVKIVSSIKEFDTVYRPPLLSCKDRMPFLSERVRFRWCKLSIAGKSCRSKSMDLKMTNFSADSMMLHYHLCILLLVDILEASHYFSLLEEIQDAAGVAENAVMNTLEFGLRNLYTIQVDIGDYPSVVRGKAVPILAFDPYPHHVVACVRLIGKAIERDLQAGKLSPPAYQSVHETLRQVLEQLPGTSKSVQAARSSHNQ